MIDPDNRAMPHHLLTGRADNLCMTRDDLEHIWESANQRLATGSEPVWVWDQYLKLCEILDVLFAGMAQATRDAPRGARQARPHLRIVADNGVRRTAPLGFELGS